MVVHERGLLNESLDMKEPWVASKCIYVAAIYASSRPICTKA
jgi:hypothetical protein